MTHDLIDRRSLALHRAVAEWLRRDPSLLKIAKDNLKRWLVNREFYENDPLMEWRLILGKSLNDILSLLETDDENARRLRQSSPFAGVLPETERLEIFHRYATLGA